MTPDTFQEAYGFDPIHMIDLKALMGDASDNISGVPGIGEKTAMGLIQTYGSIDAVYENLDSTGLKAGMLCKLKDGEAAARHSYWMATIVTDVPMVFDPADALRKPFKPELYDVFLRLEFQKFIDKYHLTPGHQAETHWGVHRRGGGTDGREPGGGVFGAVAGGGARHRVQPAGSVRPGGGM